MSLVVMCQDQAEVDRPWDACLDGGGRRWRGCRTHVASHGRLEVLPQMLNDKDRDKSKRVMEAMMQMVKLDIDKLQQACNPSA